MEKSSGDSVLFERRGSLGLATLNREASLNALSLDMIERLLPQLSAWEKDAAVKAIFLQGAGPKAFCAGGDIRKIYEAIRAAGPSPTEIPGAARFFEAEYRLDYRLHRYPKPVIVWGQGIVMGGGLGLMAGGRYRLVTESSKIAMPEISIGLYPDVGASYFLQHMPPGVGLFLALTGARLNAADALAVRLATHFVESSSKDALLEELSQGGDFSRALERAQKASAAKLPVSEVEKRLPTLAKLARVENLNEVLRFFESEKSDPWIGAAYETFKKGSPTSAAVIFAQFKRSRGLTLRQAFQSEMQLTMQFARHHDFSEGVRALLIDKDQKPQWRPASLDEVSDDIVEAHLAPFWKSNPLSDLE